MDTIINFVLMFAGVLIFVYVLSGASERMTEIIKKITLGITKGKYPHGDFSWLLALVPAFGMVYGLDLEFLTQFKMFQEIDPELVKLLNALFIWIVSNQQHDKGLGKAVAKK